MAKRKVRKGAARTAKQKAALRKAQLVSARKRKGKKNPSASRQAAKGRRRVKIAMAAQLAIVATGAALYGAQRYRSRRSSSVSPNAARTRVKKQTQPRINIGNVRFSSTGGAKTSSSDFDRRYRAAVAYRQSQVAATKRKKRNATYARQSKKMVERALYKSGLPSNVGSRTFVAGRGGVYRR